MTYDPTPLLAQTFESSPFPNDPDAPALDCETAALMRGWLSPLIEQAANWPGFLDALKLRGYGLAFRSGRLWLVHRDTSRRVCTMRHLGASMRDLAVRFGRPAVRPIPGNPSWGEIHVRTEH
ncbi:MAG: hypothetical protein ACWA5A_01365 [Marinibacterium sp.]